MAVPSLIKVLGLIESESELTVLYLIHKCDSLYQYMRNFYD